MKNTPGDYTSTGQGVNRRRIIAATALVWASIHILTMTTRVITLGFEFIQPITPFSIGFSLFIAIALRYKFSTSVLAFLLLTNIAFVTYFFSYLSSGLKGPVIYITPIIPIMAFLLINRTTGWLVTVLVMGMTLLFAYLNFTDYPFPRRPVSGKGIYIARGLAVTTLIFFTSWISWYYTKVNDRFFKSIHQKNEDLTRISQHKTDFLSHVSHEFRTPLNSIIGFSLRLQKNRNGDLDERTIHALNAIHRGGAHLLTMVNEILDMTKIESGNLELETSKIELTPVISDACDQLKVLAEEKSLSFELVDKTNSKPLFVMADSTRLRQVISNLVSNAVKYTDKGGVTVTLQKSADYAKISVQDTGCGIPAEDIPHLFERFRRQKKHERSQISGTGLGLAITERLVTMLNGSIAVTSEVNKGSCFTVQMPLVH